MGLACVEARGSSLIWIGHEVVKVSSAQDDSLPARLRAIHKGIELAITLWQPEAVAAEEVFFAKNPQSALKLGQARGAALLVTALSNLPLFEYSATLVKQTITGSGRAEKEQVQKMVRAILGGHKNLEFQRNDASDALAVAICHLQHRHKHALLGRGGKEKPLARSQAPGKTSL